MPNHDSNARPEVRRRTLTVAGAIGLGAALAGCVTKSGQAPSTSGAGATPSASKTGVRTASALTPAPPKALSWGPSEADFAQAQARVKSMSVEEKIGQVLVPFYRGSDPTEQLRLVEQLHLAGTIIMGDNVPLDPQGLVDLRAMSDLLAEFQRVVRASRPWSAILSVDQEGGLVQRLKEPLTLWPTPMSYGAGNNRTRTRDALSALGSELRALGFTMDHAPSIDVTIGEQDPVIGARSFGSDSSMVSSQGLAALDGLAKCGLLPSAKHFPGHGSVTTDSHVALPVQNAPLAQLRARDWIPFQDVIKAGVPVIMMGHIAVQALEPGVPSSVSAPSYQALRDLGFEGVIITDALNMGAVAQAYPNGLAALKALESGADLLLMPEDVSAAHAAILDAINRSALPMQRLDEAATRVATLMLWYQRVNPEAARPPLNVIGSAQHQRLSQEVSVNALTVLTGSCGPGPALVNSCQLVASLAGDRTKFMDAANRAGVRVGDQGPVVSLAISGVAPVAADFTVTLDAPWPLAQSAAPSKISLYGRSPRAFDALLAYLSQGAPSPGALPVAVGPYPVGTGCR